ncbi:MAG TPA: ATP-binding cassette domain-containing protein [Lacisediminihabitans sp.]|uniref:ATP-binding cassette domain-containing protein n=1 Tax=Lacisediminihabitans sp. TaxID=2787631 RepID=UPI002ED7A3D6
MIEIEGLSKRYGTKLAVDDVSFTVRPGIVTGFLGPNGAGKSTTMRMIMGLDSPSAGRALVAGQPYARLRSPLHEVGALLEAKAVHTGRTAFNHLLALAATHGIPRSRVHEVIAMTGLESVASKRVGGFSLGMGQRLGIAAALLGDPHTLILDEPVNGLDPEGVRWVREFCRYLASQGRTVFISSHLMSEMSQTADHLIVLGRGRVLADAPIAQVISGATRRVVRVRTPRARALTAALTGPGVTITSFDDGALEVSGLEAAQVGDAAAAAGIALHELTPVDASLEEAYLELTRDDVEYHSEVTR